MHKDQVRRSGEPYLIHPLQRRLAPRRPQVRPDLRRRRAAPRRARGHPHHPRGAGEEFGAEITELVDGVTKIGRHAYVRRDEAQAETFRKMILASAKDIRVILVKLADRLHNMQTLEHLSPEARRRISRETLEIYAPIAHRLGMAQGQGRPRGPRLLPPLPAPVRRAARARSQEKMKRRPARPSSASASGSSASLEEAGIEAEISFRVKRYYSIYQKLRRQGIDISQLYDYLAFRIVTAEPARHLRRARRRPPELAPDPRAGSRTTSRCPSPTSTSRCTPRWSASAGSPSRCRSAPARWTWSPRRGSPPTGATRRARLEPARRATPTSSGCASSWSGRRRSQDPRTFLTTLKIDLYPDEVYVFTPKGEVFSFPRGATPLDFAYRVHTDLGHHCAGARVNGKLVPLRTPLQNGDMVEILTNPARHPSRDWLNLVATSRAKSKIRHWLNTQQKQRRHRDRPPAAREGAAAATSVTPKKVAGRPGAARPTSPTRACPRLEDLYSRLGFGKIGVAPGAGAACWARSSWPSRRQKPGRLRQAVDAASCPSAAAGRSRSRGTATCWPYLAKCCNPLPGEEIVGYVTRGRGVSVHSVDCPNVQNLLYNPEREIEVEWAQQKDERLPGRR